jgi:SPP1 gp7 family putative phage head morphogenesis protein
LSPLPFVIPTGRITHRWFKALTLRLDRDDDEAEQKARMGLERRFEKEMKRALNDMMETLYPPGWDTDYPYSEPARIHQAFLNDQRMRDTVSRALQDGADLGVSVAVDQLENVGYGFDYTLANVRARDWALAHTDTLLNQLGTTSSRVVGQAVARWIENSEPLEKLVEDITPTFGRDRAATIAKTEITRAYAQGTRESYIDSGIVTRVVWRTSSDEYVCPICWPLNGTTIDIKTGEFFDNLPQAVKDKLGTKNRFGYPPAHPNCRCWHVAVIEDLTPDE